MSDDDEPYNGPIDETEWAYHVWPVTPAKSLHKLDELMARLAAKVARQARADALGDECCRWIERVGRAARKNAPF